MHDGWLIDTRPPAEEIRRAAAWALAAVGFGALFVGAGLWPTFEWTMLRLIPIVVGLLTFMGGKPSMRRLMRALKPPRLALTPTGVEYSGGPGRQLQVSWADVRSAELRTAQLVYSRRAQRREGAVLTALQLNLAPHADPEGVADAQRLKRDDGVYQVRVGGRSGSALQAHDALLRYLPGRYSGSQHVGDVSEHAEYAPF
ncbi:hypothetical protein FHS23_000984 [Prauserella isguenensis]|uniref:Uncharacterized protein n=1 Tax=Prauserella isguenensis TaxID=1470180 RepID=A0A839RZI7_9PSEU|nr:hypothetical protein [Prauserella isguenensis]MBB3049989.1 hypothetical protein [Prauserella isguenensis]